MTREVVVDASVVIKTLLSEEHQRQADALLCYYASGSMLAPSHLASEVTNALYQRTRRRSDGITLDQAERGIARFLGFAITLLDDPQLYATALQFAAQHGLPDAYDSLYVVLALVLGADMWTADQALLRGLAGTAPWVRWIGDFPLD